MTFYLKTQQHTFERAFQVTNATGRPLRRGEEDSVPRRKDQHAMLRRQEEVLHRQGSQRHAPRGGAGGCTLNSSREPRAPERRLLPRRCLVCFFSFVFFLTPKTEYQRELSTQNVQVVVVSRDAPRTTRVCPFHTYKTVSQPPKLLNFVRRRPLSLRPGGDRRRDHDGVRRHRRRARGRGGNARRRAHARANIRARRLTPFTIRLFAP